MHVASFYLKMCKLIIKELFFLKLKINLDIILSEITFDYGVVKSWVAYILKTVYLQMEI